VYITPICPGMWDHWKEDWVIEWANVDDRLALPAESPTAKRSDWEETPKLQVAYGPVIERIRHVMSHGLSVMLLLHDFLSKCITPLQDHATGEGNITRL
jgi:hypothetical protein